MDIQACLSQRVLVGFVNRGLLVHGKRRSMLVILVTSFAMLTLTSARADQPPSKDRKALAAELFELIQPEMVSAMVLAVQDARLTAVGVFCLGKCLNLQLDEPTFSASLGAAARAAIASTKSDLIHSYAEVISVDDLAAAVAFYRSGPGQTALREKQAFLEKLSARVNQGSIAGMSPYQPTSAETTFLASGAGRALVAAGQRPQGEYAAVDLLQSTIDATEAAYCARQRCDVTHSRLFKLMRGAVDRTRAHGEHAMSGNTAGDLFPDTENANLARAACIGDAAGVAQAIKVGAQVNVEGRESIGPGAVRVTPTPLIWAIDCDNAAGVSALLDAGADPNKTEKYGASAVILAAGNSDPALLKMLLKRGGNPNARTDLKLALEEAMDAAHSLQRLHQIPKAQAWANWDALIEAGADPFLVASKGRPLIEILGFEGDWDRVEWLMERGWKGDPAEMGRVIEAAEDIAIRTGRPTGPEAMTSIARIKDRLRAMGVQFPTSPATGRS